MNYISPKYSLLLSFLLMVTSYVQAQPLPVVVKTYGEHYAGQIAYHHQVTNNGSRDVVGIAIGLDTDDQGSDHPATREQGELNFVMPKGAELCNPKINPASISGPTGWTAQVIQIEHTGCYLQWSRPKYPKSGIQVGQTLNFSVTVPQYAQEYIAGHFSAAYPVDGGPRYFNGAMELLDKVPPILTVTLTPSTVRENDKLVPITATISVKDDYDPLPEIKLESITANEVLEASDIRDASFGTDDRQFLLKAEHEERNTTARVYMVVYSATDASGNQSLASATVTVQEEERMHEDHRDKENKKSGKD